MRIRIASIQPPAAPAISPMSPPMMTPDATTASAPNQLVCMPTRTRLSSSRPAVSVPSRLWALGPIIGWPAGASGS